MEATIYSFLSQTVVSQTCSSWSWRLCPDTHVHTNYTWTRQLCVMFQVWLVCLISLSFKSSTRVSVASNELSNSHIHLCLSDLQLLCNSFQYCFLEEKKKKSSQCSSDYSVLSSLFKVWSISKRRERSWAVKWIWFVVLCRWWLQTFHEIRLCSHKSNNTKDFVIMLGVSHH